MTAKTSQHLADVLRAAGLHGLAERAETDEFHDYLSNHALPQAELAEALRWVIQNDKNSEKMRMDAHMIRQRLIDGEFEASDEESDEWAVSPEGISAFELLTQDLGKRSKH